jgi:hypothetical protein
MEEDVEEELFFSFSVNNLFPGDMNLQVNRTFIENTNAKLKLFDLISVWERLGIWQSTCNYSSLHRSSFTRCGDGKKPASFCYLDSH